MAEFDKELYMCKALTMNDEVLQGFYVKGYILGKDIQHSIITIPQEKVIDGDVCVARRIEEINPYTLCRNTGIKKNGIYLYENDLVEYSTAFDKGSAIIEFDEMRCRYMLRFNLDYSSRGDIDRYNIKVVGNVTLNDDDMKRFAEYSKNQIFTEDVEPECRSKAHINKRAKEFLPK
jgi:hypothetical protein